MGWLTPTTARTMTEEERLDYLVRTVLGEAVSEGPMGMMVVAQVIANRTTDARWPADPVAVAGQPFQFTTNSPRGGNQEMVDQYGKDTPEYQQAERIVRAAVFERSVPDIVGGAKHYHTIEMGWPASWPSSVKKHGYMDIGAHRVYPEHPVPPGTVPNANVLAFLNEPATAVGAANALAGERPFEIKDVTNALSFNFGEMTNPNALVIHHTGGSGTKRPNVNGVIQTFKDRNFPAHFIIDRDGTVYRALPETAKGQHTKPSERRDIPDISNDNAWGVEIIALDDTDVLPAQTQAAVNLAQYLSKGYGMPTNRVVGHGYINGHKQTTEGQSTVIAMRQAGLSVAAYAANLQPMTGVGTALAINDPFTAAKVRTSVSMPTSASERALARAGALPVAMPGDVRLQREVNRVAAQRRDKIYTDIRKSRVLAFNNVDPFEAGPSGVRLTPVKPQRATGSVATTARTFALQNTDVGMDAPGLTLTRTLIKPPVRQTTPWGPRETVAAAVAAADAEAGRGQLVMTGNPNIAGSVVDWLYPRIPEGQGEANQEGKGPRARVDAATASVGRGKAAASPGMAAVAEIAAREARAVPQSPIERNPPRRPAPGQSVIERVAPRQPETVEVPQSTIERNPPRVVVSNGAARVVPQSQIERNAPDLFAVTSRRAEMATRPALAKSLMLEVASKRTRIAAASPMPFTSAEIEMRAPLVRDVPYRDLARPGQSIIERNPPKPKADVGLPTDVRERELARGNPLFGQPAVDGKLRTVTMPTARELRPTVSGFPTAASQRPRVVGWPTDASGRPTSPAARVTMPTPANQRPAQAQQSSGGGSSSSGSSSSSQSAAPRFVSAVTGEALYARETLRFNASAPDGGKFETVTVYEPRRR